MMNPAQPMITMCRTMPALMMTNAIQSGASWPSWSSGTLRQPPAIACHPSTAPQSVSPHADDVREKPRSDLRVALGFGDALRLVDDERAQRDQSERDQELAGVDRRRARSFLHQTEGVDERQHVLLLGFHIGLELVARP